MMRARNWRVAALVFVTAVGCGDPTGITPDDLAGTWTATEFVFTNATNASQSVDWIPLGASLTLTFREDGTFTMTLREPDGSVDSAAGTTSVAGTVLTISESGQGSPTSFTAVRNGDVLTLTDTDEEYDFDDDGSEESAILRIVLRR